MRDTSGRSLPLPSMRFDQDSSSWRTCEATSLWDLEMSSPSFPEWGMTRGGELFELPTPEPHTVAHGSSSLPTPHAGLGERGRDGVYPNPRGQQDLQHAISSLLPTPVADHSRGLAQPGTDYSSLPNVAISLLPTPTVMDMGSNYTPEQWEAWKAKQRAMHANGNGHGASLTQEAISLLPTPTAQQGRNATSGRQPGAVFNSGTTLQDVIYAGEIGPLIGESTQSPSGDGSPSSAGQHPTQQPQEPTDDHDSPLTLWNG